MAARLVEREMHLQLDQARNGPLRWHEHLESAAACSGKDGAGRDGAIVLGSVDCEGSLVFVGPDYLLEGTLHYRQRLHCDRCLTAYEQEVDLPLAFVVTNRHDDVSATDDGAGARELEPEDLSTLSAVEGAVDLAVLVREQVELNLPMKPICDPSCRGLCPQCGADRKREVCTCAGERPDPRWSGLEAIRERLGGV
ncbi:MAG: DUF177 domain-containing protein [Acidobacteria bacterium]|nr:DUF177 domain-containing protein [Acidobacteriota bacterium]